MDNTRRLLIDVRKMLHEIHDGAYDKEVFVRLMARVDFAVLELDPRMPKKAQPKRSWWYRYRDDRIVERFQKGESVEDISFAQGTSQEVVKKVLRERLAGTWAIEKL